MQRYMKIGLLFLLSLLFLASSAWARPTNPGQARQVVERWLALDKQPLGATLGQQVKKVQTYRDDSGEVLYYVVYLNPQGMVIVAGDDLVEPIIYTNRYALI